MYIQSKHTPRAFIFCTYLQKIFPHCRVKSLLVKQWPRKVLIYHWKNKKKCTRRELNPRPSGSVAKRLFYPNFSPRSLTKIAVTFDPEEISRTNLCSTLLTIRAIVYITCTALCMRAHREEMIFSKKTQKVAHTGGKWKPKIGFFIASTTELEAQIQTRMISNGYKQAPMGVVMFFFWYFF